MSSGTKMKLPAPRKPTTTPATEEQSERGKRATVTRSTGIFSCSSVGLGRNIMRTTNKVTMAKRSSRNLSETHEEATPPLKAPTAEITPAAKAIRHCTRLLLKCAAPATTVEKKTWVTTRAATVLTSSATIPSKGGT